MKLMTLNKKSETYIFKKSVIVQAISIIGVLLLFTSVIFIMTSESSLSSELPGMIFGISFALILIHGVFSRLEFNTQTIIKRGFLSKKEYAWSEIQDVKTHRSKSLMKGSKEEIHLVLKNSQENSSDEIIYSFRKMKNLPVDEIVRIMNEYREKYGG